MLQIGRDVVKANQATRPIRVMCRLLKISQERFLRVGRTSVEKKPGRGPHGDLRMARGLVQPASSSLVARLLSPINYEKELLTTTVNAIKLGVLGTSLRNAGRHDEAVQTFRRCLEHHPEFHFAHTSMAVEHGMQGDLESARREVARTLKLDPTCTVKRFISPNLYRDKTVMDRCAEVLRSAGMPESD
jgi:tetratricopeptide (TPR) repeat protein